MNVELDNNKPCSHTNYELVNISSIIRKVTHTERNEQVQLLGCISLP